MERYEFRDGSSHKFWEVSVAGDTVTVRFGRIGTDGQTKEKAHGSAEAAEKEKAKLVKEKTGKGYVAAGSSAPPAPAAVKKASALARAVAVATDEAPPTPPAAPVAVRASPVADRNARILAATPMPTRTRPGKAQSAEESRVALAQMQLIDGASTGASLVGLTPVEAAKHFEAIQAASARTLGYRAAPGEDKAHAVAACRHLAHWIVDARGPGFALEVADVAIGMQKTGGGGYYLAGGWSSATLIGLRSAVTSASEADYDAALAQCLATPSNDAGRDAQIAFVLADDRPAPHALQMLAVLERAAANQIDVASIPSFLPLIAEAPATAQWRPKRSYFLYFSYFFAGAAEIALTTAAAATARGESALPVLDWLLHYATEQDRTALACAILDTREDEALATLAPYLHDKHVRAALDRAAQTYPDWTFQRLLNLLAGGRAEPALRARAVMAIEAHGLETARAWAASLGGRGQGYFETLAAASEQPIADAADLPSFLRDPPWRRKKGRSDDLVLKLETKDAPLAFKAGPVPDPLPWLGDSVVKDAAALLACIEESERMFANNSWGRVPPSARPVPATPAMEEAALAWLDHRLDELSAFPRYSWGGYARLAAVVERHFEALSLLVWSKPTIMQAGWSVDWTDRIEGMLTRFGKRALPGLVRIAESDPAALLPCLMDVDTPALAPVAARAVLKLKKARAHGRAWLKAHPRAALLGLVSLAVGPAGEARDAAEAAVRVFKAEKPDLLDAVVAEYAADAPQIVEAMHQVLTRDPFARTPSKIGKLPAWLAVGSLTRPQLKAGGALSNEAMVALVEMLSFVNPADVYAGVPALRETFTSDSLARFAWDLFGAWLAEGAPSKDGWAFRAVGWLGDDECARQLTRLMRKWPGESAHARAATGLDVLADIGTDVALMNLNGIAEKVKFKGLQDRARDKIASLAEARELSPEDLADRLAPDLDLDARGGLDLDFGPRTFRAGFDEFLKPWVKDASGARLKDLPKPLKSDDADKAKDATARWAALKKDARAIASLQLARLENMLATGRRTKPEVFNAFFATHPLIRHLAQRLVWGLYDGDDPDAPPTTLFRVGEDLTLTDGEDNPAAIDLCAETGGFVGLAHPLHMRANEQERWGALFGDYEIAQPFPQLGRETYALTESEKDADALRRFAGREVESKRLRGMAGRGWRTGAPQDGGGISWIERAVRLSDGTAATVALGFEEGLYAGAASEEPTMQTLHAVTIGEAYWNRQDAPKLGRLGAVTASEIVRAVTLLVESQGA